MRVLVVEDEELLAEAIADGLTAEGFDVDVAHDGLDGLWRAREGSYDAIVLDILLPGMNGYKVCRTLRDEGVWTPILMLTAKDGEYDEAEALDTGADDFLSKPFSFVVLVARLRALLRRGAPPRPNVLTVGTLELDPRHATCSARRHRHRLTPREFALLEFLMRKDGERRVEGRPARPGVGHRLRGRSQRRRGVRRLPPQEDRRAVRHREHRDGARRRLPPRRRTVMDGRGIEPSSPIAGGRSPFGVRLTVIATLAVRDRD